MYEITKTRMLLTLAVFAAVAAVFAGGANARALAEDGSRVGAEPVAQAPHGSGRFSVDEICAALALELSRGVLTNEEAIKAAAPGASEDCSPAPAAKSITPMLTYSEATYGVSEWAVISTSDVVSRYLNNNRTAGSEKRVARPRPSKYPDGRRSAP